MRAPLRRRILSLHNEIGAARAPWLLLGLLALLAALLVPASPQGEQRVEVASNLSLGGLVEILASSDLASGINFTDLSPGTSANNATKNYNSSDSNNTSYWVGASPNNGGPIDLCVSASGPLATGGGETIALAGNYTFNDSALNTTAFATPPGRDFNTSPGKKASTQSIAPGNRVYFRFYLNVPDGQSAGNYANIVTFKAVAAGNACG